MTDAARQLESSKMARFDERSGNLYVTELGRVASHFYVKHNTIVIFNEALKRHMSEAEVGSQQLHDTGPHESEFGWAPFKITKIVMLENQQDGLSSAAVFSCVCSDTAGHPGT